MNWKETPSQSVAVKTLKGITSYSNILAILNLHFLTTIYC